MTAAVVMTRTLLPTGRAWDPCTETAPPELPPEFAAARPVLGEPDRDELDVRAWLRRRICGVG
jgi:hypothetical protein